METLVKIATIITMATAVLTGKPTPLHTATKVFPRKVVIGEKYLHVLEQNYIKKYDKTTLTFLTSTTYEDNSGLASDIAVDSKYVYVLSDKHTRGVSMGKIGILTIIDKEDYSQIQKVNLWNKNKNGGDTVFWFHKILIDKKSSDHYLLSKKVYIEQYTSSIDATVLLRRQITAPEYTTIDLKEADAAILAGDNEYLYYTDKNGMYVFDKQKTEIKKHIQHDARITSILVDDRYIYAIDTDDNHRDRHLLKWDKESFTLVGKHKTQCDVLTAINNDYLYCGLVSWSDWNSHHGKKLSSIVTVDKNLAPVTNFYPDMDVGSYSTQVYADNDHVYYYINDYTHANNSLSMFDKPPSPKKIQEIYDKVQSQNNIAGYVWFLKQYPVTTSMFMDAHSKMAKLLYQEVTVSDTIEAYNAFVDCFPFSLYAQKANERAYKLEEKKYTDLGALGFYDRDKKMESRAQALRIQCKKIEEALPRPIEELNVVQIAVNSGHLLIMERMNRLLKKRFDQSNTTLRYMESSSYANFNRMIAGLQETTDKVQKYKRYPVDLSKTLMIILVKYLEQSPDKLIKEYYEKRSAEWEAYRASPRQPQAKTTTISLQKKHRKEPTKNKLLELIKNSRKYLTPHAEDTPAKQEQTNQIQPLKESLNLLLRSLSGKHKQQARH